MLLKIIISGIVATASMTLFTNMAALLLKNNLFVVKILAALLELKSNRGMKYSTGTKVLAVTIHYMIGVLFALICFEWVPKMIQKESAMNDWWIWGLILGVIAVSGWAIFKSLRSGNSLPVAWNRFSVLIFFGHLIFSLIQYIVFFKVFP